MDSRSWREGRPGKYAATAGLWPSRSERAQPAPTVPAAATLPPEPSRSSTGARIGLALTAAALLVPGVTASTPVSFTDAAAQSATHTALGWLHRDAGGGAPAGPGGVSGQPAVAPADAPAAGDSTEPFDALPDLSTVRVDFAPPGQAAILASGFVLPVHGVPTSPFGLRLHPIQHVWKLHSGQDLAAACGTPVVAVKDGTIGFVGRLGGYGGRVVLDHGGGLVTTYNHLSAYAAVPGLVVRQGQVIGFVGTTGMSTGCHLHFEVQVNGAFVDPAPYLGMAPAPKVVIPPAVTPTPVGAATSATASPTTATPGAGSPGPAAPPATHSAPTAASTSAPTSVPPTTAPPTSAPPSTPTATCPPSPSTGTATATATAGTGTSGPCPTATTTTTPSATTSAPTAPPTTTGPATGQSAAVRDKASVVTGSATTATASRTSTTAAATNGDGPG